MSENWGYLATDPDKDSRFLRMTILSQVERMGWCRVQDIYDDISDYSHSVIYSVVRDLCIAGKIIGEDCVGKPWEHESMPIAVVRRKR